MNFQALQPVVIAQRFTSESFPPPLPPSGRQDGLLVGGAGFGSVLLAVVGTLSVAAIAQRTPSLWPKRREPFQVDLAAAESATNVEVTATGVRTKDYFKVDISIVAYIIGSDTRKDRAIGELPDDLSSFLVSRIDSVLRSIVGEMAMDELLSHRDDLNEKIKRGLDDKVRRLGLNVVDVALGRVEENATYSETNFFDALVLERRASLIQESIHKARQAELSFQLKTRRVELEAEKNLQDVEKEMKISAMSKEQEVHHAQLQFKDAIALQEHTFEKKAMERSQDIQQARIETESLIRSMESKQRHDTDVEKIKQEMQLAERNKELIDAQSDFQRHQAEQQHKLESLELELLVKILEKQQDKLEAEQEKAKAAEAIHTAVEVEKANCRHLTAIKAADAAKAEAMAMNAITEADSKRYESIPPNDSERLARIIRDLAPNLVEKLPELCRSLAPQPGVLGDSNIYSFPDGDAEKVHQLMLSTSGMLLLNSLLEGKLGQILEKLLQQMRTQGGTSAP